MKRLIGGLKQNDEQWPLDQEEDNSKLCRLGFFSAFYRVGFRSPCFWNAHSRL
ncbi:hypothetical protein LR48_Vigan08g051600 [Vigna angularis]|uniref:Uncharacterized protein n=1 Tax=Phaseolus angularis TaxID=3914 RepID=A0A0L9V4N9_PHAAN|nr:hypothetical protein LR48_Vigan08g051600 [Vigna angularis]